MEKKKKKKEEYAPQRKPNSSSYYVLKKSQPSFLNAEWDNQAPKNPSLLHKNLYYLSVKSLPREMLRPERSGAYFSISLYPWTRTKGPHHSQGDGDASDRQTTHFAI